MVIALEQMTVPSVREYSPRSCVLRPVETHRRRSYWTRAHVPRTATLSTFQQSFDMDLLLAASYSRSLFSSHDTPHDSFEHEHGSDHEKAIRQVLMLASPHPVSISFTVLLDLESTEDRSFRRVEY